MAMDPSRRLSLGLCAWARDPSGGRDLRELIRLGSSHGLGTVQIDATDRATRPRDMDRSARRELAALLRRHELGCSGVDLLIPASHFEDPGHADRAMDASLGAIGLAADLASLTASRPGVVTIALGGVRDDGLVRTLEGAADRAGALVADLHVPYEPRDSGPIGIAIDPASVIAHGQDPASIATSSGDRLVAARLSDTASGMRTIPGEPGGSLDLMSYVASLDAAGFRSTVTLDLRGIPSPEQSIAQAIGHWNRACGFPGG